MNFEQNCYLINSAYVLTDKQKSRLIGLLRNSDPVLEQILSSYNSDKDPTKFYDNLKNNGLLGSKSGFESQNKLDTRDLNFLTKIPFEDFLRKFCGSNFKVVIDRRG